MAPPGALMVTPSPPSLQGPLEDQLYCCPCKQGPLLKHNLPEPSRQSLKSKGCQQNSRPGRRKQATAVLEISRNCKDLNTIDRLTKAQPITATGWTAMVKLGEAGMM